VEDEIFIEIMSKVTKAGMWDAIKDDGRLGYRGAPGISAHLTAIVCVSFRLSPYLLHNQQRPSSRSTITVLTALITRRCWKGWLTID